MRYPGIDAQLQKAARLVIPVHRNPLWRKVCSKRDAKLIFARNIKREAFLVNPAGNVRGQERLRRVVHMCWVAERLRHIATPRAEVVLIHHHDGRTVLFGNLWKGHASDSHDPVFFSFGVAWPYVRGKRIKRCGHVLPPTSVPARSRRSCRVRLQVPGAPPSPVRSGRYATAQLLRQASAGSGRRRKTCGRS